jgi:hypothetical protein
MASKLPIVLILGFMFLAFAPSSAQTTSELKQKYGSPDEKGRYTVRTGILVSAVLDENRKVRRMVIVPDDRITSSDGSQKLMTHDNANVIINELEPVAQRGKHRRSLVFNAGCVSVATDEYERVTTSISLTGCSAKAGVMSAEILWK